MSGGHFEYQQYHIDDIANSLEDYLEGHELDECDVEEYIHDQFWYDLDEEDKKAVAWIREHKHTLPNHYGYNEETLKEFRKGLDLLRKAAIYAQRIDWLLSGDDGEDSFKERLAEDLQQLEDSKQK